MFENEISTRWTLSGFDTLAKGFDILDKKLSYILNTKFVGVMFRVDVSWMSVAKNGNKTWMKKVSS